MVPNLLSMMKTDDDDDDDDDNDNNNNNNNSINFLYISKQNNLMANIKTSNITQTITYIKPTKTREASPYNSYTK